MKKITEDQRIIANIHTAIYMPFRVDDPSYTGLRCLQLDDSWPPGYGFNIFRMEARTSSQPHEHTCNEVFLVIEGELIDNDGTIYSAGDFVFLKQGTQHSSFTSGGCLLAVFCPNRWYRSKTKAVGIRTQRRDWVPHPIGPPSQGNLTSDAGCKARKLPVE